MSSKTESSSLEPVSDDPPSLRAKKDTLDHNDFQAEVYHVTHVFIRNILQIPQIDIDTMRMLGAAFAVQWESKRVFLNLCRVDDDSLGSVGCSLKFADAGNMFSIPGVFFNIVERFGLDPKTFLSRQGTTEKEAISMSIIAGFINWVRKWTEEEDRAAKEGRNVQALIGWQPDGAKKYRGAGNRRADTCGPTEVAVPAAMSKDVFEAFCLKWSQLNGTACNKLREYWKVGDWIGVVNILGHVTIDSGKTSRKVQVDVFLTINETTSKGNAPEMLNLIRTAVLFKYPKCTYIHYKDGREKAKKPDESKIMFLMRMKKTEAKPSRSAMLALQKHLDDVKRDTKSTRDQVRGKNAKSKAAPPTKSAKRRS